MSDKADRAEMAMYRKVLKALKPFKVHPFAPPAGSATTFPDFGMEVMMGGQKCHIHIEFKLSTKEQMGSLRSWCFESGKFSVTGKELERAKENYEEDKSDKVLAAAFKKAQEKNITDMELIDIMNGSTAAKSGARRVLHEMQKLINPNIKKIYSGMFSDSAIFKSKTSPQDKFENILPFYRVGSNKKNAKKMLLEQYYRKYKKYPKDVEKSSHPLVSEASGYEIAHIADSSLGKMMLHHYTEKFKISQREYSNGINYCILLIIMGDQVWFVSDKMKDKKKADIIMKDLETALCGEGKKIPTISQITAELEIRIQPRAMNAKLISSDTFELLPGENPYLDVMASFRMKSCNTRGGVVK